MDVLDSHKFKTHEERLAVMLAVVHEIMGSMAYELLDMQGIKRPDQTIVMKSLSILEIMDVVKKSIIEKVFNDIKDCRKIGSHNDNKK